MGNVSKYFSKDSAQIYRDFGISGANPQQWLKDVNALAGGPSVSKTLSLNVISGAIFNLSNQIKKASSGQAAIDQSDITDLLGLEKAMSADGTTYVAFNGATPYDANASGNPLSTQNAATDKQADTQSGKGPSGSNAGVITINLSGPMAGWQKSKQSDGSIVYDDPNVFGNSGSCLVLDETSSGIGFWLVGDPDSDIEAEITPHGGEQYSISLYSGTTNQNTLWTELKWVTYDRAGHIIPPPSGITTSGLPPRTLDIAELIDKDVKAVDAEIPNESSGLKTEGQTAINAASAALSKPSLKSASGLYNIAAGGNYAVDLGKVQVNVPKSYEAPLTSAIGKLYADASGYYSDFSTPIIGGAQGHDHEGPDTPIDNSYVGAVLSAIEQYGNIKLSLPSWGVTVSGIKNLVNYIEVTMARSQGDGVLNSDGSKLITDAETWEKNPKDLQAPSGTIASIMVQDVDAIDAEIPSGSPQLKSEGQAVKNAASACISKPGSNSTTALYKAIWGNYQTDLAIAQVNVPKADEVPLTSAIGKLYSDASGYPSDYTSTGSIKLSGPTPSAILYGDLDTFKKRASNNKDLNPANIGAMNALDREVYDDVHPSVPTDTLGLLKHEIDVTNIDLSMGDQSGISQLGANIEGYAQTIANDINKSGTTAQEKAAISGANNDFTQYQKNDTTGGPSAQDIFLLTLFLPMILDIVPGALEGILGESAGVGSELGSAGTESELGSAALELKQGAGENAGSEAGSEADSSSSYPGSLMSSPASSDAGTVASSPEGELVSEAGGSPSPPTKAEPTPGTEELEPGTEKLDPTADDIKKATQTYNDFDRQIGKMTKPQLKNLESYYRANIKILNKLVDGTSLNSNDNYLNILNSIKLNNSVLYLAKYFLGWSMPADELAEATADLGEAALNGELGSVLAFIQRYSWD